MCQSTNWENWLMCQHRKIPNYFKHRCLHFKRFFSVINSCCFNVCHWRPLQPSQKWDDMSCQVEEKREFEEFSLNHKRRNSLCTASFHSIWYFMFLLSIHSHPSHRRWCRRLIPTVASTLPTEERHIYVRSWEFLWNRDHYSECQNVSRRVESTYHL